MRLLVRNMVVMAATLAAVTAVAPSVASASPLPVQADSAPAVVSQGGGSNTFVVVRTKDDRLFYNTGNWTAAWNNGGWNEWKEVPGGGRTPFAPAVARLNGKNYVVVVGANGNSMFTQAFNGGSWEGSWQEIPGGGTFTAGPAVAAQDGAQLAFLAPGLSGQVHYQRWHLTLGFYDGGWHNTIAGLTTKTAVGASYAYSSLNVVARGDDKRVYRTRSTSTHAFEAWSEIPGGGLTNHAPALATVPTANYGDGLVAVVRGVNDGLFYQTTDSALGWRPSWKVLTHAGNTSFAPAVTYNNGWVTPFVVGLNRGVYGQAVGPSDATGSTYVPNTVYGGWFVVPGSVVPGGGGGTPLPAVPDLTWIGEPQINTAQQKVTFSFKNQGSVAANGFIVQVLIRDANGFEQDRDELVYSSVAAGSGDTITYTYQSLPYGGTIHYMLDLYETVQEGNEGNNGFTRYIL